jgi:transcriptional regulator with XRE-family HTH domain
MAKSSDLMAGRVRQLRTGKGWSQEKLAEEAGLSKDAVSRIERGNRGPRMDTLEQIAKAVGTTLPKLVDFGEPPPATEPRNEQLLALERSLDQVEPWLSESLIRAIRLVVYARIRSLKKSKRSLKKQSAKDPAEGKVSKPRGGRGNGRKPGGKGKGKGKPRPRS